jgi:hypothetical protein
MTVVIKRLVPPKKRLLAIVLILAAVLALPAVAEATTITVTTAGDVAAGQCTLRKAIVAANTDTFTDGCAAGSPFPGVDTIDFAAGIGNTIVAGTPLPVVLGNLFIVGPGAGALTISGGDAVSLFHVENTGAVTISGLTIAHARCTFACGLFNQGTLTLERVAIEGNMAVIEGGTSTFAEGGGILNQASLTLVESTVAGNIAKGAGGSSQNAPAGGGIYNQAGATLTLERSTVSGNSSLGSSTGAGSTNGTGGGIANFGALVVRQSTISGNVASGTGSTTFNSAIGGGITNANSPAVTVAIDRSTIAGNSVVATGAGINNAQGGGFSVFGSSFIVRSSTIAGNSGPLSANLTGGALANFANTIVAAPLGGGPNCGIAVTSAGYNLESAASCGFGKASDKPSTNPLLSPTGLAANGGPTPTIALLDGSPAIDAGLSSVGEIVDQRGLTRPVEIPGVANAAGGDGTDIGAFEVQLPVVPVTPGEPEKSTPPGDTAPKAPPVPPRDTVAPKATISGVKAKTTARRLRIRFASSEPGSSFSCKLDRAAYRPCRSPFKTKKLGLGRHSFAVIATDPAGNASKPAKKKFRIVAPD